MIEIHGLTKRYSSNTAIEHVSFDIPDKGVLGFLGRNGAGKSTTMNIVTGYLAATGGTVMVDGIDAFDNPVEARRNLGYLPEQPPLYVDMTVKEYLRFASELKGAAKKDIRNQVEKAAQDVALADKMDKLIRSLSKGYKQRVGIAQAILGDPKYIILDEPTSGLDPIQIVEIRSLIKKLADERAVVLSSHILGEISSICDRVVIIHRGKIVENDTVEALTERLSRCDELIARGRNDAMRAVLEGVDGVRSVDTLGAREEGTCDYLIKCEAGRDCRENILASCIKSGAGLLMLRPLDVSLEDVFLRAVEEKEALVGSGV